MKPKDKKTFALMTVLCCSLFLCLALHDTRPWAGRPSINVRNSRLLEVGCMGTQKTAGGDRLFPITGTLYSFGGNGRFVHTYHRFMTGYDARLGLYVTVTRNTYVVGSLNIERFDMAYSSVNPSKVTKKALAGPLNSPVPLPKTGP